MFKGFKSLSLSDKAILIISSLVFIGLSFSLIFSIANIQNQILKIFTGIIIIAFAIFFNIAFIFTFAKVKIHRHLAEINYIASIILIVLLHVLIILKFIALEFQDNAVYMFYFLAIFGIITDSYIFIIFCHFTKITNEAKYIKIINLICKIILLCLISLISFQLNAWYIYLSILILILHHLNKKQFI